MARRKSHAKKRHHTKRRRSHSAIRGIGGNLMSSAYVIGGAIIAQAVSKAVSTAMASSKMSATTKGLINGAVPVVAGIFTPKFIKGDVGAKLGAGMIAVGGLKLVQSVGVMNGIGAMKNPYYNMPVRNIAGYQGSSQGTYIAGVGSDKITATAILEQN
jgi:hypothetical protein